MKSPRRNFTPSSSSKKRSSRRRSSEFVEGPRRKSGDFLDIIRGGASILASPMATSKHTNRTPAGAHLKVMPRRPSKRNSVTYKKKLCMTDYEDPMHVLTPPSKQRRGMTRKTRRMSCMDGVGGQNMVFRMRSNSLVDTNVDPFRRLTDSMLNRGIKMLAIDWDQTMISCHTRSQWYGTAEELAKHVRPTFRKLVTAAMQSGLNICIVSFSSQLALIRSAITAAGLDISRITVRCSDKKTWKITDERFRDIFPDACHDSPGKLPHLCSAAEALCHSDKENNSHIAPHNIVLIDDDCANVQSAHENGVIAVHMDIEQPDSFLQELSNNFF